MELADQKNLLPPTVTDSNSLSLGLMEPADQGESLPPMVTGLVTGGNHLSLGLVEYPDHGQAFLPQTVIDHNSPSSCFWNMWSESHDPIDLYTKQSQIANRYIYWVVITFDFPPHPP